MTNYNKTLENRLKDLFYAGHMYGELGVTWEDPDVITLDTKQAITSLIKELVAEAKPPVIDTPSRIKIYADNEGQMWYDRGQNDTIARFEQNLLKELENKSE